MTEPSYNSRPTLLYLYQGLIRQPRMSRSGTMLPPLQPVAAAEQLTADIKAGRLEVAPALLSDFRLLPRPDDQLTVKVNGSKGRNANEFYCRSLMTMHPPEPWSRPAPIKPARLKPARLARRKPSVSNNITEAVDALKNRSLKKAETVLWKEFQSTIRGLTYREFRTAVQLARKKSSKR